jgi:hypothetical protein
MIPVSPVLITQVNCEAAAGLKPWKFQDLIVARAIPHRVEGRLKIVETTALLAALHVERSAEIELPSSGDEVDRLLSLVGRKRA